MEQKTHSFRSEIKKRPDRKKNSSCSNSFKDQAQLGSFFLRKGNSEEQRFSFFRLVNQTSMTQTETKQGINKLADIHLQSETKRRQAREAQEFNNQTKQK